MRKLKWIAVLIMCFSPLGASAQTSLKPYPDGGRRSGLAYTVTGELNYSALFNTVFLTIQK